MLRSFLLLSGVALALLSSCRCEQEGAYTTHGAPTGGDPMKACEAAGGSAAALKCEQGCGDTASCPAGFACAEHGYCEHSTIPNCLRCP